MENEMIEDVLFWCLIEKFKRAFMNSFKSSRKAFETDLNSPQIHKLTTNFNTTI